MRIDGTIDPMSEPAGSEPEDVELSVVVTIVDGPEAVRGCVAALTEQEGVPPLEIIVPYDDSVKAVEAMADDFPGVRFLPLGAVGTDRPIESPGGQHELYDRRRSVGLTATSGDIVCILEDRGIPEPGWAAEILRLHAELPYAVIGGAVECGENGSLHRAVYFCDYGRYQKPFEPGPREYVTDVNISYKRRALEKTRHLWKDRYHETTVHWELERMGETLYLTPEFVVWQHRGALRLPAVLKERFEWGRLFAYTRVRDIGGLRRWAYAALSPVLPLLLLGRHTRLQARKRVQFGRFLRVSPLVALLLAAWSLGEVVGYVTGRP